MAIPAVNKILVFKVSPSYGTSVPCCFRSHPIGSSASLAALTSILLRSNVKPGKRIKESKDVQEPQNHGNDYDAVQN
jgi:hypothetical protein